ncbi:MAG: 50S ribosomal protein L20 [Spirochaetota bacterium]
MPRAKSGTIHKKKARKILKAAKGFKGGRSVLFRTAKDARRRALENSYAHRRAKKRDMRSLWITRINAAARMCGISYSRLMHGLKESQIDIDRKMLADLAVSDMNAFKSVVDKVSAV